MEQKKNGRPSRGERKRLPVRLPEDFADAAQKEAKRRGMTFNDLVGELLAPVIGMPYQDQEALPLTA